MKKENIETRIETLKPLTEENLEKIIIFKNLIKDPIFNQSEDRGKIIRTIIAKINADEEITRYCVVYSSYKNGNKMFLAVAYYNPQGNEVNKELTEKRIPYIKNVEMPVQIPEDSWDLYPVY